MLPTVITGVTAAPLALPLTEPFAIAGGVQHAAENVLVTVTLAGGARGLGEAAPFPAVSGETQERTAAAAAAASAALVGRDVRSWRALAAHLAAALPDEPAARCGLEMALLDALCRHHGMPLWSFFGGAGTRLETDMTITAGDRAHAEGAARSIAARGIRTLKVKVGALAPAEDAERMLAAHRAAPGLRLYADANGAWDAGQAIAFLDAVERAGVPLALFEQPVARDRPADLARVARHGRVPVCADESARSAADVLELARTGASHAVNIKLMKCGVAESLTMWSVARAAGLALMIGGMVEGPLAMAFSGHLAAGLGGFDFVDLDTHLFVASHPFEGGFEVLGGSLELGHVTAGHGVVLSSGG